MQGEVRNAQGERLDYTYHEAGPESGDSQETGPLVIIGHGVTGNKDRPFVVALAEGLAAAGVDTLRLSFSGNGESEGRFEDSTISKEVDDLGAMLDAVEDRSVCFIGHSMGGAVGVIRASQDSRIRWLVSLAGMVHTRAFAAREFSDVTPGVGCMWEEPSCPLSQTYMDNMNRIDSVADLGSKISVPWLLVHGTEDDVVPPQDADDIRQRAGSHVETIRLEGADHVFSDDPAQMVALVVAWVRSQTQG